MYRYVVFIADSSEAPPIYTKLSIFKDGNK